MRRILISAALAVMAAAPAWGAPGDRAIEDVKFLSSDAMQGRRVGAEGAADARLYILGRMREIGLEPIDQEFPYKLKSGEEVTATNLMARIPGTEPGGKVIVVTAHYDHLGVHDGQIYNGADDNASGVAGLLAVAEAFKVKPPRHDVWIVFLDAEEGGLAGARAFLAKPPVPAERIGLNINFDMISKNTKGELYAAGGSTQPWVKAQLDALAPTVPVSLKQGHDTGPLDSFDNWTMQSDHGPFAKAGFAWVYFGVEDHPEYHKPTDDFATIPQDFFRKAVDTVVLAARRFDDNLASLPERAR